MKTNNCFAMMLLPAATLLLAGCQSDGLDESKDQVPITLTATVIEDQGPLDTRAAADLQGAQLANGTTFAAEFTSSDVSPSSVTYTANGSGGATPTTQPYIKISSTSATVHAYCPSKPSSTFSVQANQSGDANYKASDLMYAMAPVTKSSSMAFGALQFSHKMAKIIVNVMPGDGVSSITAVKIIGGYRTINVTNTTTCTLGTTLTNALSTSSPITVWTGTHSSGTLSCAALIPPQTVSNKDFLQIVTNKGTLTYKLNSKTFASGGKYTFNVFVFYSNGLYA